MSFWKKIFGVKESPQPILSQAQSVALGDQSRTLLWAAGDGDLEKVKALLKANPDLVFSRDVDSETPLHKAIWEGHTDVAGLLLANGARINDKNRFGNTPLHLAARKGHRDVTELLLANKADVNAGDNDRYTPLHEAAYWGHKHVAQLLLANGADVDANDNHSGQTPLHWAASRGHKDVAEFLLANKADVNAKDKNGVTALYLASGNGHCDVVQALLDKGADASDLSGANIKRWKLSGEPQAWVSKHLHGWNHNEWIELLARLRKSQYWPMQEAAIGQLIETLRHEAMSDRQEAIQAQVASNFDTPLLLEAARTGDIAGVQQLLKKGANVNATAPGGFTSLYLASQKGHREVVQALLDKGADVNAKDNDGKTALYMASQKGHREVVQALLDKGADVNARDKVGYTALMWASYNGRREVVQVLLDKGADVNARNKDGYTALMWASLNGQSEVVQALLDKGADVNARNKDGYTALMLASGHREVVQALIDKGADSSDLSGANINRWKLSGEPQAWVRKHLHGWNHNDWLELLASLRKSQYWPMDEAAIGQHLEMLRHNMQSRTQKEEPQKQELDLREAATICIILLKDAHDWGERRGFGATWIEDSPQYEEIRAIGKSVNEAAGLKGMQIVIQLVRQSYRHGYLLDHFWDRIGKWFA